MIQLGGGWDEALAPLFSDEHYKKIRAFLKEEYSRHVVYPDMYDIFNCFKFTPLDNVKVVILGQDPYHNEGQAHGLCFSVQDGIEPPPSLVNIYKELHDDLGCPIPRSGNLTKWAKQGVLLLNTALTVRVHMANSHKNCGWTWFTDSVISLISEKKRTRRIYTLGRQCTLEKAPDRPVKTPRSRMCTPLSSVRIQRILRLQAFLQSKQLPYQPWNHTR